MFHSLKPMKRIGITLDIMQNRIGPIDYNQVDIYFLDQKEKRQREKWEKARELKALKKRMKRMRNKSFQG